MRELLYAHVRYHAKPPSGPAVIGWRDIWTVLLESACVITVLAAQVTMATLCSCGNILELFMLCFHGDHRLVNISAVNLQFYI
jgi:hypothetical protein